MLLLEYLILSWAVVAHAFSLRTQEAGESLSSNPASSAEWVTGQLGLQNSLSKIKTKKKENKQTKRIFNYLYNELWLTQFVKLMPF